MNSKGRLPLCLLPPLAAFLLASRVHHHISHRSHRESSQKLWVGSNASFENRRPVHHATTLEEGIFRDLHAGFTLLEPPSILGISIRFKISRHAGPNIISLAFMLITDSLLLFDVMERPSSYYFFKTYYVH